MVKRWKPLRFALVGAWLGVGFQIAMMPAVLAREDLPSIIGGMVGGAVGDRNADHARSVPLTGICATPALDASDEKHRILICT